jgi:addiction module HigA family antidote
MDDNGLLLEVTMTMPGDPIHPGKFLADELAALEITPTELARVLHVPPNRIYQILSGKRAMTADTALRLSQWLGTSAEIWMNLQKLYELRLAEQQVGEEIKRTIPRQSSLLEQTTNPLL